MAFQLPRNKALQWLLVLLTATMLSACGFQLRGAAKLPFKTVYFAGIDKNTPLGVELLRNIRLSGAEVVDTLADADATLQMLTNVPERKIEALDTSGNVLDYALYQRFSFVLKDKKGVPLVGPLTIVLKRDVTYNPNQELAKQTEESLLYLDMQHDLVAQMIRRMSAAKPQTGDGTITQP